MSKQFDPFYYLKYSSFMVKAVFPGTFDPPTKGHINLIRRSAELFDSLDVIIAVNTQKSPLLTPDERLMLINESIKGISGVTVKLWDRLVVDYAEEHNIKVILRGVRNMADFGYEFELSMMNKQLNSLVETIFLPTDPKYFVLRSSSIKELLKFNADISQMVPEHVEKLLRSKQSGY
jgi:pantetheine-phosphate adenylyltransferase